MDPLLVITNRDAGTADEENLDAALAVLRSRASVEVASTSNPGELDGVLHRAASRRIVAFTVALAALTTLVFGTAPAFRAYTHPVLAGPIVRHAGEAVAVVVAADPYAAADGAERVTIEWQRLPAVTTPAGTSRRRARRTAGPRPGCR